MKVKEVSTTATIAWSPRAVPAPHLVCATAALHADPTSKNDSVQVYSLNLGEENLSMKSVGSISTSTRFHDVVWGVGGSQVTGNAGVVACAGDDGSIYVYNGEKLMNGDSSPLVTSMQGKHAGPVLALDFNHHQPNLLASGSSDCEVFIWDIKDPVTPMSPGTKATLAADVTSVAWNRQVEHILASSYAGRCVVFDLRKSTSILQISDAVSRVKATTVCWHPNVATQLALASSDDATPVCQLWDLRFASAPVRQCDGHQRGVQSLAWCEQDPDMLCSAGKDNRVLCWNSSTGELLCELPSYNQWSFDAAWCPRDPALLATATVDGSVSVFSLLGGGYAPPRDVKFSTIADSFPGMEMPAEVPAAAQPQHIYPRRPPSFLAPRAGCSFGFGGRLLTWHSGSRAVEISQVVTEPELVERSSQLLTSLSSTGLPQYCSDKMASITDEDEKEVWQYLSASLYGEQSSAQYLTLLGHPPPATPPQLSPQEEGALATQMGGLVATEGSTGSLDPSEQFEMIASAQSCDKTPEPELVDSDSLVPEGRAMVVSTEEDDSGGSLRRAVITGNLPQAVELCLQKHKFSLAVVLAQHHGHELYVKTRDRVLCLESDSNEVCGLVSAVVRGDLDSVVSQCNLQHWRQAVVTVITHAPLDQRTALLQRLGERLEEGPKLKAALVCYLIAGALDSLVRCWVRTKQESTLSTAHLQELVELILVMQHSGRVAAPDPGAAPDSSTASSSVAQYLAQYASLLATQGALTTALHYLSNNTAAQTQSELVELKDRLSRALGYTGASAGRGAAGRGRSTSTTSNSSLPAYRRTSTPSSSFQPSQFTPSVQARQASAFSQPPPAQLAAAAPPPPAVMQQQPGFFQPQQQQPQTFAPSQPQYGGFQPCSTAPAGPPPSGPPPTGPPAASLSAPGGLRRLGAVPRYVSTPATGMPPAAAVAPFQPFQPTNSLHSQQPASFLEPTPPPAAMAAPYDPHHQQEGALGEPSKPPAAFDPTVPRGWNDPPPMSSGRRAKQQAAAAAAAASTPAEPINAMVPTQQPQPFQPQPQQHGFQGFQQQAPPGGFGAQQQAPPGGFGGQQQAPPGGFGGQQLPPPPSQQLPPPPAQQQQRATPLPIPPEAQGVHDVLNGLYSRALQSAPNLNMRQTFESVGPKLEALYDKLRANQISAATLQGLQSLSSCLEAGDYHRALQVHSQTVSKGNFAEMSPFMPAIKKLITSCMQCQIFLN